MKRQGFSLIELLVGVGLFAVLLGTANVLLFSALRSARKASAVGVAKSEGAYALNAMTPIIKFARSISCTAADRLQVTRTNGSVLEYRLTGGAVASVSASPAFTVNLTSTNITIARCSGWASIFNCDATPPSPASVSICYTADQAGTSLAGEGGAVIFQSQVVLRNFGN